MSLLPSSPKASEPHPDLVALTQNSDASKNTKSGVDYEPHPESSIELSPERQSVVDSICRLYSGSASEQDMRVYAEEAIYDDPWSYCDTRYKIAGQWYGKLPLIPALASYSSKSGIPKIFTSRTLATEVVKSDDSQIVFKLRQEYTPKVLPKGKAVNSLVSLALDGQGKITYHKDMWNEKDYSHEGLGMAFKKLNGDYLTGITQPPKSL